MLNLLDILQIWQENDYSILCRAQKPVSYFDAQILDIHTVPRSGTLYIADTSVDLTAFAANHQIGLLLVNASVSIPEQTCCDIALLNTSDDLPGLLNAVKDRIRERAAFLTASAGLVKQALETCDMQQFAQQCAEIAKNPVAIYSLWNNRLLAFAPADGNQEIVDPILCEYLRTGTAIRSPDFMESCRKYLEKGLKSSAPFICETGSGGKINMLCWHICLENNAIVLFCIYEICRKIQYSDHYLALMATDVLSSMLKMNPHIREYVLKDNAYYVNKLLKNGFADPDAIRIWLQARQWHAADAYRVIVAESSQANLPMLEAILNNTLVYCQCIKQDQAVVTIYNASFGVNPGDQLNQLAKVASQNNIQVGVSSECRSLLALKKPYQQAQRALELGKRFMPEHHTFFYDDLYIDDLLLNLQDSDRLASYIHPAIERLKAYDAESNSQYMDTLRAFMNNNMNKKATATELFIHANTLNYRLKRICEIGGLDFADLNDMLRLTLSLHIKKVYP